MTQSTLRWWAIPSFGGDFRITPDKARPETRCALIVREPTPAEAEALGRLGKIAVKNGWITPDATNRLAQAATHIISAPFADVGAALLKVMHRRSHGILTAVAFEGGKLCVTEAIEDLPRWFQKIQETSQTATNAEPKSNDSVAAPAATAVTVKRPTLSCPECPGKPERQRLACDVLTAFLTPQQRIDWERHRAFLVFGGRTHTCYRVSARDTDFARRTGRVTWDCDSRCVLHHHDWTVPPEEEVLAVKLCLEHREHWLRVHGEVDRYDAPMQFPTPMTLTDDYVPARVQRALWSTWTEPGAIAMMNEWRTP